MPFLKPRRMVKHITDLPASFFKERGLQAVILDVDNTLTTHNNPVPAEGVPEWIRTMQEAGLTLTILSNNYKERVEPFAKQLGLPFVSMAAKPLPFGVGRARRKLKIRRKETALIGDQIFTDMICGNLAGVYTVLVEPYELETTRSFRIRRRLEKPVIRRFLEKGGRK